MGSVVVAPGEAWSQARAGATARDAVLRVASLAGHEEHLVARTLVHGTWVHVEVRLED